MENFETTNEDRIEALAKMFKANSELILNREVSVRFLKEKLEKVGSSLSADQNVQIMRQQYQNDIARAEAEQAALKEHNFIIVQMVKDFETEK